LVLGTAALGGLAGVAIAGLPSEADPFVLNPATVQTTTSSISPPVVLPTTVATTPDTTLSPTLPATTSPSISSDEALVRERDDVRVVVVNAARVPGLASRRAAELGALGYTQVASADGLQTAGVSVVLYRPGFESEARRLAIELGLAESQIGPLGDTPQSLLDDDGDLLAVLGQDQ
jgi:hypothetical protein